MTISSNMLPLARRLMPSLLLLPSSVRMALPSAAPSHPLPSIPDATQLDASNQRQKLLREALKPLQMEDSKEAALLGEAWVHSMDYDKLCARVAFFASALTPRVARRAFQLYPAIGMIDAEASLGTKLEALESSLGCDPLALVARSPQVLSLSAAHISERVEALRSISPDFDAVIVAFPQVLNHNPDSLLHKIKELDAALPDYVDAVDLIKVNPKLLGYNVSNTLLPKLKRYHTLLDSS